MKCYLVLKHFTAYQIEIIAYVILKEKFRNQIYLFTNVSELRSEKMNQILTEVKSS